MARTQINASLIPTAQYVSKYRRPVLQWNSVTTVNVQDQIYTGITGDCTVLFTDGKLITVNNTTQTRFDITRNAVLSGSKQSGLRTGSEASNTWYALYAVRATDNDDTWVTVGDTVFPVNSSITTLNTNFGTDKWIYLGLIRNGDNEGIASDILKFSQTGNMTIFYNTTSQFSGTIGQPGNGTKLAATSSATSLTYTYSAGSGAANIPSNIGMAWYKTQNSPITGNILVREAANTFNFFLQHSGGGVGDRNHLAPAFVGVQVSNGPGSSIAYAIALVGWVDDALGVGPNPLV